MVLIAVHGSASRFVPAERGTVRLGVEVEHDDRAAAMDRIAVLHERFRSEAEAFVAAGAATWWGSDQVWVRHEERYEGRDERPHRVHVATARVHVRFRDFAALSAWILDAGAEPQVRIERIDWEVTRNRRAETERAMRVEAVRDALARAEAYASAIGGTGVTLQAVWEAGLRPESATPESRWTAQAMSARAASSELALRPDDIEISARVTADLLVDATG